MGIITPYSAQVRLLQDVVSTSRRSAAAAAAAREPRKGGEWPREDEGGSYNDSGDGGGGGGGGPRGGGRARRGNKRGGIALPEIASVDGYQGREKEVPERACFHLLTCVCVRARCLRFVSGIYVSYSQGKERVSIPPRCTVDLPKA